MEKGAVLFCQAIMALVIAGLVGKNRKIGFSWSFVLCLVLGVIGILITFWSDKVDKDKFEEM